MTTGQQLFDLANKQIQFTLKWEVVRNKQGKVVAEHDPDDPGGVTKYGIDKSAHPEIACPILKI